MEETLGYIIFGTGWPVLILASIWIYFKTASQMGLTKTLVHIALISFYVLGYTCTAYWMGASWLIGVLPAFAIFLVLIIWMIMAVKKAA
jgi:hypothetical protein